MLEIKELYNLPYKALSLTDWVLRDDWFPELSASLTCFNSEVLEVLQAEARLQVRELVNVYGDGYRVTEMHTLWFDGEPVFIVQNAGRGGSDHRKRWVTDSARYWALLAYLFSKCCTSDEAFDSVDPSTQVYEEEVFCFYGQDFSAQFGYAVEPRAPGYCLMGHATSLVPGAGTDWVLAMLDKAVAQPHPYIRRGACVLQLSRALTQAELDSNPRLTQSLEGTSFDRYVWYVPASRPDNETVLSV